MHKLSGKGTSMLPSMFPGAKVDTCQVLPDSVRVGDVLCFVGDQQTVAAHRVVGIENEGGEGHGSGSAEQVFLLRGDSQSTVERVPASAVLLKVTRVNQRFLSYDLGGRTGWFFEWLALSTRPSLRGTRRAAVQACSLAHRFWRRFERVRQGALRMG